MAAIDYFLKIDGVEGESQDSKHKGEIDLDSWSWGRPNREHPAAGRGGGGAGKVSMQDFNFVTKVNKSSPKLLIACASGQHLPKALLTCRKAGKDQQEFLEINFSDLLVTSFTTGGTEAGGNVPVDEVSLSFAKIEYEYREKSRMAPWARRLRWDGM